ncbi:MAG: hypothetical protein HUN04_25425 [Desulfobacter sp.]|nr:MAG: hypothetical protein HUN04_25425 [Desulfobacter sp.]
MIKGRCIFIQLIWLLVWAALVFARTDESIEPLMAFSDDEFFSSDSLVLRTREAGLLDKDFSGVAVSAPQHIWTTDVDWLPLVMAIAQSGDRDWEIRLPANCILAGTNMRTGAVRFAAAFGHETGNKTPIDGSPDLDGPKPPGLALRMAQMTRLDARRLQMDWDTGTWSIGVINFDQASNTVVVELHGDREPVPLMSTPVHPEPASRAIGGMPCYRPTAKTPDPPEYGLRFSSEYSMEGNTPRLNIFGAFTLSIHDYHLAGEKSMHHLKDGGRTDIAAVIPVTLAVVGLNREAPVRFDWAVPVYGKPLARGMLGRGYFSINALAGGEKAVFPPGKNLCYIIMNGKIFGPEPIKVTDANRKTK